MERIRATCHRTVVNGESQPIRLAVDAQGGGETGERECIAAETTSKVNDAVVIAPIQSRQPMEGDRLRRRLLEAGTIEQHQVGVRELRARSDAQHGRLGDRRCETRVVPGSQVGDDLEQVTVRQTGGDQSGDLTTGRLGSKGYDLTLLHAGGMENAISAKTAHST